MIKIEFPADRPDIARALGQALTKIGAACADQGCPAHCAGDVPRMGDEAARQLAEDLSTEEVEVVHANPKPSAESLFDGASAGTAEVAEEAGTDQPITPTAGSPAAASSSNLDDKGVAFDAAYCGRAVEPFYATGKAKGQWKKKKGVDQADYDAWYSEQLSLAPKSEAEHVGAPALQNAVDASAAFGGRQQAPAPEPEDNTPADAGSLMVWVSEKQAAGLVTQEDVNSAWGAAGVASPAELFGPNAAEAVKAVFQHLKAKV